MSVTQTARKSLAAEAADEAVEPLAAELVQQAAVAVLEDVVDVLVPMVPAAMAFRIPETVTANSRTLRRRDHERKSVGYGEIV